MKELEKEEEEVESEPEAEAEVEEDEDLDMEEEEEVETTTPRKRRIVKEKVKKRRTAPVKAAVKRGKKASHPKASTSNLPADRKSVV